MTTRTGRAAAILGAPEPRRRAARVSSSLLGFALLAGVAVVAVACAAPRGPAGGAVAFKPGGLHVMLMDLERDLKPGDTFSLTLKFEKAGARSVQVTVRQP